MARLHLPTKEMDLADALDAELVPAETEANVNLVSYKVVDAYLAGIRKFKVVDRFAGNVSIGFENARGELDLRYEEVLRLFLVEAGRWMKADLSPQVMKKGESLGALRKAAIAHAVLAARTQRIPQNRLRNRVIIPFLKYGTVGLCHYETGDPDMPDLVEVVPPRQLRGLPAWTDGLENVYAIARKRWVPLNWLLERAKKVYNKTLSGADPELDLMASDVPWGSVPPGLTTQEYGVGHTGGSFGGTTTIDRSAIGMTLGEKRTARWGKDEAERKLVDGRLYVPLEEIYVYDETGEYVARYLIKVGKKIIFDQDYEKQGLKIVCPLQVARHTDTGRFFARGFVAPLIPFNAQIERLLASLFRNIAELDMFGTIFVPGGSGIDIKKFKTGPRPKIEKFEVDPVNPTLQPFNIAPSNTGLLPSRVAEFAMTLMQKLAGQGPYYGGETSGRVDSAAGLGFLFNTGNISLGLPSHGLADAFSGVYSRILQVTKDTLGPGDTIELATIDDAIAGVIIDAAAGTMELTANPIPHPWEVEVNVKDRTPREREVRKAELLDLMQRGLLGPDDTRFWITSFEENLDFPGPPKEVWETWRKAIWQIIVLFRDGKTPGTIDFGEHTQNASIQLIALSRFMSKIEYSLASPEVRQAFETWKESLERLTGANYPVGLPPPEEIAAAQQQAQQQAESQGGGGMSPFGGSPPPG
jgi:hypothetical protein